MKFLVLIIMIKIISLITFLPIAKKRKAIPKTNVHKENSKIIEYKTNTQDGRMKRQFTRQKMKKTKDGFECEILTFNARELPKSLNQT